MKIYSPVLNPCPFARKKLFAMYGTATNTIKNDISIFPVFVCCCCCCRYCDSNLFALFSVVECRFVRFFIFILSFVGQYCLPLRTINSHIYMSSYFTILSAKYFFFCWCCCCCVLLFVYACAYCS